jgi:signal transduction histidine kinase
MRWPLRYQIMIPVAAAMVVAITVLSITNAYLAGSRTTTLIERQVAGVTRTLIESNFPLTERVLKQMQGLSGAQYLLVDSQGRQVAASSKISVEHLPQDFSPGESESLQFLDSVEIGQSRYFATTLTLPRRQFDGRPLILHVLYLEDKYRDAWQRAVQPPLVIGAVSLLIAAGIGLAVAARVSQPIHRLRQQIGQIAEGKFLPLPLPRRDDEIRDLAAAVNRMAEMLARYEQEVRRTEQIHTLGHLGSAIAHQLRNSSTGAQMAIDIHRDECPMGEESESLDVAARQLAMIEKYLQKFLALDTRAQAGDAVVDLVELLESLKPLLAPTAKHVGVELTIRVPPKPVAVPGNRDALEHVLLNLLLNAIEAAGSVREGAERPPSAVTAILDSDGTRSTLTIEDTGPGPTGDIAGRMFEPFVTDKLHGTGLGLALAKNIVAAHDGTIQWQRRNDRTCFVIDLPCGTKEENGGQIIGD